MLYSRPCFYAGCIACFGDMWQLNVSTSQTWGKCVDQPIKTSYLPTSFDCIIYQLSMYIHFSG